MEYRLPQNRPVSDLVPFFQSSNISSSNWLSVSRTLIMESEMPVLGRNLKAQFTIVFSSHFFKVCVPRGLLAFLDSLTTTFYFFNTCFGHCIEFYNTGSQDCKIVASKKITTFSEYIGFVDDSATGTFVMLNSSLA